MVEPAGLAVADVVDHAADRVGNHRDALGEELDSGVAVGLLPDRGHDAHVDLVEECVEPDRREAAGQLHAVQLCRLLPDGGIHVAADE